MGMEYTTDRVETGDAGPTYCYKHELLSASATYALLERAAHRACCLHTRQEGPTPDAEDAIDTLARHNVRLVLSIAKAYTRSTIELQDLMQFGMLGLLTAIAKFDLERRTPSGEPIKFSTYATYWIRQTISRATYDTSTTVRLPVHIGESRTQIRRAAAALMVELQRDPTPEEIAERIGMRPERVRMVLGAAAAVLSLDAPVRTARSGKDLYLSDLVPDSDTPVEDQAIAATLRADVEDLLDLIPEREARILILRYGLRGEEPRTLDAVGRAIGLTRERVRQIEEGTLKRLREAARLMGARAYLGDDAPRLDLGRRRAARELAETIARGPDRASA